MSNYKHDPAPNHRAKQFAAYCAEHIKEWPHGKFAAASGKFKKLCFVDRVNGLSHAIWATCSRQQWLAAKQNACTTRMAKVAKTTAPTTPQTTGLKGLLTRNLSHMLRALTHPFYR
jgi:hypothetical protein